MSKWISRTLTQIARRFSGSYSGEIHEVIGNTEWLIDNVATVKSRKPQPFRCRDCRKHFSVKTGTLMHSAKIPLSRWAIAFYLYSTNLKGVSSMKLHRDLGIRQASAWYMAHRI